MPLTNANLLAASDLQPTALAATAVLAPSTRDSRTRPITTILPQQKQQESIQRDLQLTGAHPKTKQIDLIIKSDTSDNARSIREDTKNVAALIDDEQLEHVEQQRIDALVNLCENVLEKTSVAANSNNEGGLSDKDGTYGKETMGAQFGTTLLSASFDDSACSPIPHIGDVGNIRDEEVSNREDANRNEFSLSPSLKTSFDDSACTSDEESPGVGHIIVAGKTVLESPSRLSQMDKTFASSDESSRGDEEALVMIADEVPSDVEDVNRRRKMMIAMGCCIVFLIVLVSILVVFVGRPKKRSDVSATVGVVGVVPVTIVSPITSNEPSSSPDHFLSFISRPHANPFIEEDVRSSRPSTSPTMTTQPSSEPSISASPSFSPSFLPTISTEPTSTPSASPSVSTQPTGSPSTFPSAAPFVLFTYGKSLYADNALGIQISVGLTAKRIAQP